MARQFNFDTGVLASSGYKSDSSDGWDDSDDEQESIAVPEGPQIRAPDMTAVRTFTHASVEKSNFHIKVEHFVTMENGQQVVFRDEPHRKLFPSIVIPSELMKYQFLYIGICLDHPNTDSIPVSLPEATKKSQNGITHNGRGMWIEPSVYKNNVVSFKKKTTTSHSSGNHCGFTLGQPYEQATSPAKPQFIIFICPYHDNSFLMDKMAKTSSFLCMSKRPERFLTKGKRRRTNIQENYNADTDICNAKRTLELAQRENLHVEHFNRQTDRLFDQLRDSLDNLNDPILKCALGFAIKKRKQVATATL